MNKFILKNAGLLLLPAFILFFNINVFAQERDNDSTHTYKTAEIVVTGRGYENKLANSSVAISVFNEEELQRLPINNFSEAVKYIPGFFLFSKDGLGFDPIVGVRGYYGGGEAEYVQVIQDGVALNDVETGLVDWNLIDDSNIRKVEILRGGASALYGEQAVGGIINIFTNTGAEAVNSLRLSGGSYGGYNIGGKLNGNLLDNAYGLSASYNSNNGFRSHSNFKETDAGASYNVELDKLSGLHFAAQFSKINNDSPGPLSEDELNKDRRSSSSFYKADGKDQKRLFFTGTYNYKNTGNEVNAYVNYSYDNYNRIRTYVNSVPIISVITFTPIGVYDQELYGDTKEREFLNNGVTAGLRNLNIFLPQIKFYSGIEFSYNSYSSRFYEYYNGFESSYNSVQLKRGDKVNDADGNRLKLGAYISAEYLLTDAIRIDAGVRYDKIKDSYTSTLPDSTIDYDNSIFSPKVGINFNYSTTAGYTGNFYVNYNRSFKSPTIDQLTDLSQLNFGIFITGRDDGLVFSPYQASPFANSQLKPQKSSSFEAGFYQQLKLSDNVLSELSISLYTTKLKDEIDFDLNTLTYQNIINSNHSGVESSYRIYFGNYWNGMINYTYTKAEFTAGEYDGNRLKAIPESVFSAGVVRKDLYGFDISLFYNYVGSTYLDDENTQKLQDFFTIDAAINYNIGSSGFFIKVNNILDKKYNSTGYLLNGVQYLYPAAGITFNGGIKYTF